MTGTDCTVVWAVVWAVVWVVVWVVEALMAGEGMRGRGLPSCSLEQAAESNNDSGASSGERILERRKDPLSGFFTSGTQYINI